MRTGIIGISALALLATPAAAAGVIATSQVPAILAAALTDLPPGPNPSASDPNCADQVIAPQTDAGRMVASRGWAVTSETALGGLQLVSFAGSFTPGTSGTCAVAQGNVGVFAGIQLHALLYTANPTDTLIGALRPLEGGNVRLWGGDYLRAPVADLAAGDGTLTVTPLAATETLCSGAVSVPNVYGQPITEARTALIAAGWQPIAQPREEFGQQADLFDLDITEAVSCSGTGFAYCAYAYAANGAELSLVTAGELYDGAIPEVTSYAATCP
jgi:hypothetical protein